MKDIVLVLTAIMLLSINLLLGAFVFVPEGLGNHFNAFDNGRYYCEHCFDHDYTYGENN